ncbi:hypothetical protein PENTCL1PPCAC_28568, partial [Pristionchus entomophagus]
YPKMLSPGWSPSLLARTECFDTDHLSSFSILAVTFLAIGSALILVIIFHTFATLRKKSSFSEKMREYHRMMTIVLLIQAGVPCLLALFPLGVCFSVYFLDLNGIKILPACFIALSSYSFFHSLAVLTTTPVYRRKMIRIVRRLRRKTA